jgi:hypothetical protein
LSTLPSTAIVSPLSGLISKNLLRHSPYFSISAILNLRMDNGWKKRIEKRENRKKSQERFSLCREY